MRHERQPHYAAYLVTAVSKRHICGVHAAVAPAAGDSAQRQVRRRKRQQGGCRGLAPLGWACRARARTPGAASFVFAQGWCDKVGWEACLWDCTPQGQRPKLSPGHAQAACRIIQACIGQRAPPDQVPASRAVGTTPDMRAAGAQVPLVGQRTRRPASHVREAHAHLATACGGRRRGPRGRTPPLPAGAAWRGSGSGS